MEIGSNSTAPNHATIDSTKTPPSTPIKNEQKQQQKPKQEDSTLSVNKKAELDNEIAALNKFMEIKSTHLKFKLHDKLGEYYVQVVDDKTNDVVREIPSKDMMDTVAQLYTLIGILVDKKI
ncbi:flagellar protein FlaG [Brevibacillus daliensis]|uniref:flagellar protein FlaG n=1 Tax=Brevibacillus daliensis TaxID=2892995 RepID=UPI001E306F25|nr:flagellar protein FlaG [Brevibacillus daliensis]